MIKCVAIVVWGIVLISCAGPERQFDEAKYAAHVQLDSTVLVITQVADSLEVPWDLEVGPRDWVWFTEQRGTVNRVHVPSGTREVIGTIDDVFYRKSSGLFSMVLHPDFEAQPYLYLHYTFGGKDENFLDHIFSRIVRVEVQNGKLGAKKIILDSIPGSTYHNGSRMVIGPDDKLYIGTGDAGKTHLTQRWSGFHGKVLRLNLDGTVPEDNPQKGSYVWSTGHRNIQGIAWAKNSKLYAAEHGPNNDDEVNIIKAGGNYGWPNVEGYCDREREKQYCLDSAVVEPIFAWTPTLGVAALDVYSSEAIPEWTNSLLVSSLKAQSLRVLALDQTGDRITQHKIFFQQHFGRIRNIVSGTNGEIYLATSNMDWHPMHQPWMYTDLPKSGGDKIYRIEAATPAMKTQIASLSQATLLTEDTIQWKLPTENFSYKASSEDVLVGQQLYNTHCAACHRPDGKGSKGNIPPLVGTDWVTGSKARLIDLVLRGLNVPIEVNGVKYHGEMPSFQSLSDQELADILNFVKVEFGKQSANIIPVEIYHQRKGLH